MLTSKQRAYLRSLAAREDTILQIGKDGITENTAAAMSDALRARELVKGRVLENSLLSAREACEVLSERIMNPASEEPRHFLLETELVLRDSV